MAGQPPAASPNLTTLKNQSTKNLYPVGKQASGMSQYQMSAFAP